MIQKVLDIVQIVIMGITMLLIMAIFALIVIGRFKMAQQCLSQF
jgi:hypothetical protein